MRLIDTTELSEILRIGRNKSYELMHKKSFPSFKIGKKFFIEEEALQEWVTNQKFKKTK